MNMLYLGRQNFVGRQNRAIFAWHTTDFCRTILLANKIGWFCRSSDFPFSVDSEWMLSSDGLLLCRMQVMRWCLLIINSHTWHGTLSSMLVFIPHLTHLLVYTFILVTKFLWHCSLLITLSSLNITKCLVHVQNVLKMISHKTSYQKGFIFFCIFTLTWFHYIDKEISQLPAWCNFLLVWY